MRQGKSNDDTEKMTLAEFGALVGIETMTLRKLMSAKAQTKGAPALAPPVEGELWSNTDIARWTKLSPDTVRKRLIYQPGFPASVRLLGAGKQRRWLGTEVVAWLRRQPKRR